MRIEHTTHVRHPEPLYKIDVWGGLHYAAQTIAKAEGITLRAALSYLLLAGLQDYYQNGWVRGDSLWPTRAENADKLQYLANVEVRRTLERYGLEVPEDSDGR